ncbi:hypothetical protein HO559_08230, partial [Streptococcus suis]|nr:hypothetical protein [Streptococcus suis]
MEQFNQEQLYGVVIQTMTAASQLPMVKVNREEFLKTRFILFKKQKLTYNRFMKLTIEQTKELKTYLKDKTYSPFHRR